MLGQSVKALLLAGVLLGLCTSARANTTTPANPAVPPLLAQVNTVEVPTRLAQTDLALPPVWTPAPVTKKEEFPGHTRIALLLPARSPMLGGPSIAVRNGFQAAYERQPNGMSITFVETDDAPEAIVSAYIAAAENHDIVVGPLSRSGVAAVARSGAVSKPTIALNAADSLTGADARLPAHMLAIGLSIEDEARQVADWMNRDRPTGKTYIVHTSAGWQRRAAAAFAGQWRRYGRAVEVMEVDITEGFLHGSALDLLRKRLQDDTSAMLFAALDAWQARQLRESVGRQVPLYGTSQLNPIAMPSLTVEESLQGMDGAYLLDIPWQLQFDHPAVVNYPRLAVEPEQRRSADLERLYALGIDAYRVARGIALRHTDFMLDGATGKLTIRMSSPELRFERIMSRATYRDGTVTPIDAY